MAFSFLYEMIFFTNPLTSDIIAAIFDKIRDFFMATPVVALVGRPNVGKSTLFNRLTRTRDALVADFPGLTRDRKYGHAHIAGYDFIVIDTGGIDGTEEGGRRKNGGAIFACY